MKRNLYFPFVLALLLFNVLLVVVSFAQDLSNDSSLEAKQRIVHDQWKRLEETLLRMAETTAATDPDRAELIKKVIAQGKQKMIDPQFQTLTDLLKDGEISRALDNQKDLRADLNDLLKVLETENRMRRVKSEKERLKGYIRELEKIIAGQKNLQNRTMNADDLKKLAQDQAKLSQSADELKKKIDSDENDGAATDNQNSDANDNASDAEDKKGQNQDQNAQNQNGDANNNQNQKDQNQESQNQNSDSQKGNSQQQNESDDSQQSDSPNEESTQDRLQKAQQKMEEAQKKLEQAQKDGAVEKQEEALRELEKAKSELEEILRQLRQEEEKRKLTQLEARFKKMLEMQKTIYDATLRLDQKLKQNDGKDIDGSLSVECVRLSGRENDVFIEGNKALLLLQDDGTAVAMTEALAAAVDDMQAVIELFNKANVGLSSQTRQENILATLEELLEAIKRELKENEEQEQDQDQNGQSPEGQMIEALVDQLAELRMIRSLQMRINKTTQRCQKLIVGQAAQDPEVIKVLTDLAARQERLREILHDMSIGKNK